MFCHLLHCPAVPVFPDECQCGCNVGGRTIQFFARVLCVTEIAAAASYLLSPQGIQQDLAAALVALCEFSQHTATASLWMLS